MFQFFEGTKAAQWVGIVGGGYEVAITYVFADSDERSLVIIPLSEAPAYIRRSPRLLK
jgi:hypothetical protein